MRRPANDLQRELLRMLLPRSARREELVSERVAPALAEVGERLAGRPAAEVFAALEAVVRSAGAEPDQAALREFAAQIEAGENPFA
ncbi:MULTISPECIES: hypothetical protein [unclassified Geodermatophilus]|uniref:hypothetical protein n=1 Tax=unclassified Geodermatophilus TaxID=2637632 RepID=UPI003EEC1469